jgi:hypothetical protein
VNGFTGTFTGADIHSGSVFYMPQTVGRMFISTFSNLKNEKLESNKLVRQLNQTVLQSTLTSEILARQSIYE